MLQLYKEINTDHIQLLHKIKSQNSIPQPIYVKPKFLQDGIPSQFQIPNKLNTNYNRNLGSTVQVNKSEGYQDVFDI